MKIACFCPLQPVKSGISDYFEDLIPFLAKKEIKLDFFYEKDKPTNSFIIENCESFHHSNFPTLADSGKYNLFLYHIGNHEVHNYIYKYLFSYPGLVILHDYALHHSRLAVYVKTGNLRGYINEMGRNGRQDLGNIVAAGMGGEFLYYYYPMNHSVIDSSKMIVMHNSFLTKKIANDFPGKQVKYIPHNAKKRMIPKNRIQQLHKSLGIPEGSITVATFGFMNESKKIGLISQALCKLMPKYTDIYYLICGEDKDGIVKNEYFNYDGIRERIKVSGYVDGLESFTEYIDFSDIVINLRFPSTGETSGTMIRSMAQGKPVIVYDLPTLLDIPDTALVKIPISDNPSYLVSSLEELINNKIFRESVGKAAEDYAKEELDMDRNADLYIEAFKIVKSFQIVS